MPTYTKPDSNDDPEFLAWVEAVIQGVEETIETEDSYVVKIDKWFGSRWLGFSGKAMGTLGVHRELETFHRRGLTTA